MGIDLDSPSVLDEIRFNSERNLDVDRLVSEMESWDVDRLVSEIECIVKKLYVSNKTTSSIGKGFVMRMSEYDEDDDDYDSQIRRAETRFDGEAEESFLMTRMVIEDIMNQVSVRLQETESFHSGIAQNIKEVVAQALDVQEEDKKSERAHQEQNTCQEKASEMQEKKEADGDIGATSKMIEDIINQVSVRLQETESFHSGIAQCNETRKEVAQELDNHLTVVQEEKLGQERARAEAEEAVAKEVVLDEKEVADSTHQAARNTLALERSRLKKLERLEDLNQTLKSCSNDDFSIFERDIARAVDQLHGTQDNVIAKTKEIVEILNDPKCRVSIGIAAFAKAMMVSSSLNPFACSYAIIYVTSRFALAMDIILAEFHKACSYTVPKHDVDRKLYKRIDAIMRLYGALVQTDDFEGATNSHGIEHGLTWLARFLTNIPGNDRASATALKAFLQTAGFGLHQRYRSQFLQVVNVVRGYLEKLRAEKYSSGLQAIVTEITMYLDDQKYLEEPEGRTLETHLLSTEEPEDRCLYEGY